MSKHENVGNAVIATNSVAIEALNNESDHSGSTDNRAPDECTLEVNGWAYSLNPTFSAFDADEDTLHTRVWLVRILSVDAASTTCSVRWFRQICVGSRHYRSTKTVYDEEQAALRPLRSVEYSKETLSYVVTDELDTNYDYCAVCSQEGSLVCCSSCPRSFHLPCISLKCVSSDVWNCGFCLNALNKNKDIAYSKVSTQPGKVLSIPVEMMTVKQRIDAVFSALLPSQPFISSGCSFDLLKITWSKQLCRQKNILQYFKFSQTGIEKMKDKIQQNYRGSNAIKIIKERFPPFALSHLIAQLQLYFSANGDNRDASSVSSTSSSVSCCCSSSPFVLPSPTNVVVKAISSNDSRIALRGQGGLFAGRGGIKKLTVVGAMTGAVWTDAEYLQMYTNMSELLQHQRYAYNLPEIPGISEDLTLDCFGFGNELMLINDYQTDPCGSLPQSPNVRPNVKFLEVWHNGWPFVFVLAIENIPEGNELLLDYGGEYWLSQRVLNEQFALVQRSHDEAIRLLTYLRPGGSRLTAISLIGEAEEEQQQEEEEEEDEEEESPNIRRNCKRKLDGTIQENLCEEEILLKVDTNGFVTETNASLCKIVERLQRDNNELRTRLVAATSALTSSCISGTENKHNNNRKKQKQKQNAKTTRRVIEPPMMSCVRSTSSINIKDETAFSGEIQPNFVKHSSSFPGRLNPVRTTRNMNPKHNRRWKRLLPRGARSKSNPFIFDRNADYFLPEKKRTRLPTKHCLSSASFSSNNNEFENRDNMMMVTSSSSVMNAAAEEEEEEKEENTEKCKKMRLEGSDESSQQNTHFPPAVVGQNGFPSSVCSSRPSSSSRFRNLGSSNLINNKHLEHNNNNNNKNNNNNINNNNKNNNNNNNNTKASNRDDDFSECSSDSFSSCGDIILGRAFKSKKISCGVKKSK